NTTEETNQILLRCYEEIEMTYLREFEYDKVIECYHKCIEYFPFANFHASLAQVYTIQKQYNLAIEHLNIARASCDPIKDCLFIQDYLNKIGIIYYKINEYKNSIEYLEMSLANDIAYPTEYERFPKLIQLQDKVALDVYQDIGKKYFEEKNYFQALLTYRNALIKIIKYVPLFQDYIISLLESIDDTRQKIRPSKCHLHEYQEFLKLLKKYKMVQSHEMKQMYEADVTKYLVRTLQDNYIFLCCHENNDHKKLMYYKVILDNYNEDQYLFSLPSNEVGFSTIKECLKNIKILYSQVTNTKQKDLELHEWHNVLHGYLKNHADTEILTDDKFNELHNKKLFSELRRKNRSISHTYLGNIYKCQSNYDQAKSHYDLALDYYNTFKRLFYIEIVTLEANIGDICRESRNDKSNPNDWYEKAISTLACASF
ncbi:unnamed protein product, partial [Didymodactylos carnosus]